LQDKAASQLAELPNNIALKSQVGMLQNAVSSPWRRYLPLENSKRQITSL
jgi:hypothetical protein